MRIRQVMPVILGSVMLYGGIAANSVNLAHAEGRDREVFVSAELSASESGSSELKNYRGDEIHLDADKMTHLVFVNVWDIYEGSGDEAGVASLPAVFLQESQQVWIQPQINVTRAQLVEFQQYYPQVKPLVLDEAFGLMRSNDVWQSPYHVLKQGDKTLFSGNLSDLKRYLNVTDVVDEDVTAQTGSPENEVVVTPEHHDKLEIGDVAPLFSREALSGQTRSLKTLMEKAPDGRVSLVFLDSLCPMPHFPECEAKIAQLNQEISADTQRTWLGVVSSFYVDPSFVSQFAERFELHLPLVFDQDNRIFSQYGVHATPYQIDISTTGLIEYRGDNIR